MNHESAARLAPRIVDDETLRVASSETAADLVLSICDKMHPPLSRLAGTISYRALLSRALSLAKPKTRTLAALHFEASGRLVFDPEHPAAKFLNPVTVRDDAVILVEAFVNLLIFLIGEELTLRIIRQV